MAGNVMLCGYIISVAMETGIEQYLQKIPNCSWSNSDQYFSDDAVLHEIGFTGVMDTDTFIQTSFTINSAIPVSGALIKTFNNDNIQHENFIVYTMDLRKLISRSVVRIELQSIGLFTINTIKGIIFSLPIIALIVFNLLTYILPEPVKSVLFYLSLGAMITVISVYFYRGIPIIINFFKEKKYFIDSKKITYRDEQDAQILTEQHMKALAPLVDQNISSAIILQKKMFLKQSVDNGFTPDAINYLTSENFQNNF